MIPLAVLVAVILAAVALRAVAPSLRRQRLELELRSDWWPGFERDFREYAGAWRSARESEHRS